MDVRWAQYHVILKRRRPSRAIAVQGPEATPRGVMDRKWIGNAKDGEGEIGGGIHLLIRRRN